MDADQTVESEAAHRVSDLRAHVAALRDVSALTEALHELVPGPSDPDGAPPDFGRLVGEPVAGDGRQYEMERVLRASTVRVGSVSGPMVPSSSMIEPGQPCVMTNGNAFSWADFTWMKWMSTPSIVGLELRECVESRLALAPVVLGRPIAGELSHRRELHTL